MDFVIAAPEYVAAAAADLGNISSAIGDANLAALAPTSGVLAAGADSVSAEIAALFSAHAQAYQALSAQANLFHQQFVQLMNSGANEYAYAEAANASPLQAGLQTVQQEVLGAVNAPSQALAGSPLVGNGAVGSGAQPGGGTGRLFYGNAGSGDALTSSQVTGGTGGPVALVGNRGSGGLAGLRYGQSGNAVGAAAAAEDAELVGWGGTGGPGVSDPAGLSAGAGGQSPLLYGGGPGATGGRPAFHQGGGVRGPQAEADGPEGQPG